MPVGDNLQKQISHKMTPHFSLARFAKSLVVFLACLGGSLNTIAEPLSFESAWQRLQAQSDQLASAQAAVQSKVYQQKGLKNLGGPVVDVLATSLAYNLNVALDLSHLNSTLGQIGSQLPAPVQQLIGSGILPPLPNEYSLERHGTTTTGAITAIWPLSLGGLTEATRGFVDAQASEAQSDALQTEHELTTLLVSRYFGAQLAQQALYLRQSAEQAIAEHDAAAQKMLSAGVIAKIERLQTQLALQEAQRNTFKAQDDAALAQAALTRTLKSDTPVLPQSALFVLSQPIEPLSYFLALALQNHPGLSKVSAKKSQAEHLMAAQEALRKPQLFAFGQHELATGSADWMAGVGVRWNLWSSLDHHALTASSHKRIEQAERADAQARSDISLLVEKHWRAVDQQRRNFLTSALRLALAHELLRLRQAALREGTGTTLEMMDAQVRLTAAQTERAQAAYDYVLALAQLLQSCGVADQFVGYMARADITIE